MDIKQLQQQGKDFAPRTVAEAVLVHHEDEVKRLDLVLVRKIECIKSDDLTVTLTGPNVVIVHKNIVNPVESPKAVQVSYDEHGHITGSSPMLQLVVKIMNEDYITYGGEELTEVNFGDDFENKNNIIGLHWNNVST